MTQVSSIVRDALLHLRVQDAAEAVDAQAMQDAIRALNGMMQRWEADGVSVGWTDVSAPDDTLPAPAEAEEAISYNLAVRLRARYGVAIDPDVIQMATDGLAALRADVVANSFNRLNYDDLPAGTGQCGGMADFIAGR
jgi:hypothetical protein